MAKSVKPRWNSNEEEGEALIQAFSSGAFDIWAHDVDRLKISNTAFHKFDMPQFKGVIRRLQEKVSTLGSMEAYLASVRK